MKKKKLEYVYSTSLFSSKPYSPVEVVEKGFFGKLFCKHEYYDLVRRIKGGLLSLRGDTIVHICPKCGKIEYDYIAEFEGWGYK